MKIIIKNSNILFKAVRKIEPITKLGHAFFTQNVNGYWAQEDATFNVVTFPVEAGRTYELKSYKGLNSAQCIQAALRSEDLSESWNPEGANVKVTKCIEFYNRGTTTDSVHTITISPSQNGFIIAYVNANVPYNGKDWYLIELPDNA